MDTKTFKEFAKNMVDYIGEYMDTIRERRVLPTVEPGYLRPLIPDEAPEDPEKWQDVMGDIERVIMPGVTHWHSPSFHAYFPIANSYPAIVADMLSEGIACMGFSWISSPACTELEIVMLDWLGKMLDLPPSFLACSGGKGRGVIQGSASETTFIALLGAKAKALKKAKEEHPDWDDYKIISKLVAYASDLAHSSVEKAGLLGGVQMKLLPADADFRLKGKTLEKAIEEDREAGLIPFYAVATLGTTGSCSFDYLNEIGPVCNRADVWLHVDAAYAGSAFICPEFRYLMSGVECADSFNFNPHKWMLVNFDCSAMWLKEPMHVVNAFNVDPLYLKYDQQGAVPDYRHLQISLGRRFRALKLWFVMRLYGAAGLRKHIRDQISLAHQFDDLVRNDQRFEIVNEVLMGLVGFRLKGSNERNEALLKCINENGKIHLIPSKVRSVYFLRFVVCSRLTEPRDVAASWQEIENVANDLLAEDGLIPGK